MSEMDEVAKLKEEIALLKYAVVMHQTAADIREAESKAFRALLDSWLEERIRLKKLLADRLGALIKYGNHLDGCELAGDGGWSCTCGYVVAQQDSEKK